MGSFLKKACGVLTCMCTLRFVMYVVYKHQAHVFLFKVLSIQATEGKKEIVCINRWPLYRGLFIMNFSFWYQS